MACNQGVGTGILGNLAGCTLVYGHTGAPALFKWLPGPESALVAGRLFYMLSWFSLGACVLLFAMAWLDDGRLARQSGYLALGLVAGSALLELVWVFPLMKTMRADMALLAGDALAAKRASFGTLHAVSTVLYAIKMIAVLYFGLVRYRVKAV
ncbi:MAG: DUF4149 domain-containing protein [Limnobacter sp.]|nr:DUF4149 domain-containing protein [Limnobacter sp.]